VKLLLDTHVIFWAVMSTGQLSAVAKGAIEDKSNQTFVSIVSAWEMAIKVGLRKWPEAEPLLRNFESELANVRLGLLPITVAHVRDAGLMQSSHRDPFDRLLAAQATIEGLTLVTADAKVQALGASWLW